MESFFSHPKVELIYAVNYKFVNEAQTGILENIQIFHNRARQHSALGYVKFELQFEQLTVSTIRG